MAWQAAVRDRCACGTEEEEVEAVLGIVQRLSRKMSCPRPSECLRIQARERGELDDVMAVVLDNLEVLANGDMAQLARRAGGLVEDVASA
ncbi:MAG: hypothetical protein CM15mP115_12130 [Alphaproteobacteria bacterium]|nr:MAG: hypothetical protein CM15mP115_12130 [Alphaproteobacteria bacterium]